MRGAPAAYKKSLPLIAESRLRRKTNGCGTASSPPRAQGRTLDGKAFRLSAQRGKVVVLDFLVPGCGECEVQAPFLEQVARRFAPRGLRVLIVDVTGLEPRLLRGYYLGELRLRRALVGVDEGFRVSKRYRMNRLGLPSSSAAAEPSPGAALGLATSESWRKRSGLRSADGSTQPTTSLMTAR